MPTPIGRVTALQRVYDPNTLSWEAMLQPSTGGGAAASTQVSISTGHVTVDNFSTQVSVSGYVAPSTVVSIANFPATQPVSLATVPSHPVTGPLTDTELRAAAVPVSGTFWPATQPVSLATVPLHGVTGPLTDTELRASPIPVSGSSQVSISIPASTTASGASSAAGDVTLLSSSAQALCVYAFSVQKYSSVNNLIRFLDGSTRAAWLVSLSGPNGGGTGSTGISAAGLSELAVTPPAYLFRTAAGNPLVMSRGSSGHFSYSVAAFRV